MTEKRCGDCAYFDNADYSRISNVWGDCRQRPPEKTSFPVVSENAWCGCFVQADALAMADRNELRQWWIDHEKKKQDRAIAAREQQRRAEAERKKLRRARWDWLLGKASDNEVTA